MEQSIIKSAKYSVVESIEPKYVEVLVTYKVDGAIKHRYIFLNKTRGYTNAQYIKQAKAKFEQEGDIKNKKKAKPIAAYAPHQHGRTGLLIATCLLGVSTLALGGLVAYKYLESGNGGGGGGEVIDSYTSTVKIGNKDKDLGNEYSIYFSDSGWKKRAYTEDVVIIDGYYTAYVVFTNDSPSLSTLSWLMPDKKSDIVVTCNKKDINNFTYKKVDDARFAIQIPESQITGNIEITVTLVQNVAPITIDTATVSLDDNAAGVFNQLGNIQIPYGVSYEINLTLRDDVDPTYFDPSCVSVTAVSDKSFRPLMKDLHFTIKAGIIDRSYILTINEGVTKSPYIVISYDNGGVAPIGPVDPVGPTPIDPIIVAGFQLRYGEGVADKISFAKDILVEGQNFESTITVLQPDKIISSITFEKGGTALIEGIDFDLVPVTQQVASTEGYREYNITIYSSAIGYDLTVTNVELATPPELEKDVTVTATPSDYFSLFLPGDTEPTKEPTTEEIGTSDGALVFTMLNTNEPLYIDKDFVDITDTSEDLTVKVLDISAQTYGLGNYHAYSIVISGFKSESPSFKISFKQPVVVPKTGIFLTDNSYFLFENTTLGKNLPFYEVTQSGSDIQIVVPIVYQEGYGPESNLTLQTVSGIAPKSIAFADSSLTLTFDSFSTGQIVQFKVMEPVSDPSNISIKKNWEFIEEKDICFCDEEFEKITEPTLTYSPFIGDHGGYYCYIMPNNEESLKWTDLAQHWAFKIKGFDYPVYTQRQGQGEEPIQLCIVTPSGWPGYDLTLDVVKDSELTIAPDAFDTSDITLEYKGSDINPGSSLYVESKDGENYVEFIVYNNTSSGTIRKRSFSISGRISDLYEYSEEGGKGYLRVYGSGDFSITKISPLSTAKISTSIKNGSDYFTVRDYNSEELITSSPTQVNYINGESTLFRIKSQTTEQGRILYSLDVNNSSATITYKSGESVYNRLAESDTELGTYYIKDLLNYLNIDSIEFNLVKKDASNIPGAFTVEAGASSYYEAVLTQDWTQIGLFAGTSSSFQLTSEGKYSFYLRSTINAKDLAELISVSAIKDGTPQEVDCHIDSLYNNYYNAKITFDISTITNVTYINVTFKLPSK